MFSENFLAKIMLHCIKLAQKTSKFVLPNPMVGSALVSQDGHFLAESFHGQDGMLHAEQILLKQFSKVPEKSTLFITLEPCIHYGKTPPCVDLIVEKGIKQVVIGCRDMNPIINGRSIHKLRKHGILVIEGILKEKCSNLNYVYNKIITQSLPYVAGKIATSLDGKIAQRDGHSQWITNSSARKKAHRLRSLYQGIAIGSNTYLKDNPSLINTVQPNNQQPIKILFSSAGKISPNSNFIQKGTARKIIIAGCNMLLEKKRELTQLQVDIIQSDKKRPPLLWALKQLYQRGIYSLLVEGGGILLTSFFKENLLDSLHLFLSGKIIGANGLPWYTAHQNIPLEKLQTLRIKKNQLLDDEIYFYGEF